MPDEPILNPDLMGYPTVEALVAAKRSGDQEAQRLKSRNDELERNFVSLQSQVFQAQANPRPDIKQRGTLDDRLNEAGIPANDIRELARQVVQTEFEPIARGMTARNTLLAEYPDYTKFESDVAAHITQDPKLNETYQRMFNADPVGAFEWAFLKFGDSRRRSVQPNGQNLEAEAASHASIPSARNGDVRNQPEGNQANVEAAWKEYQRTGSRQSAETYAKARLKDVISESFLRQ